MKPNDLHAILARNKHVTVEDRGASSRAQPEPLVRDESVGAQARKGGHPARVLVRVASFRRRLCDPDNLCPKYFIDCLRYAGLLRDDTANDVALQISQEKVNTKAEERTEIILEPITEPKP